MSVFVRRGGTAAEKALTKWQKYSITYDESASQLTLISRRTSGDPASYSVTFTYYDALSFTPSGQATGSGQHSVGVSYNTYSNANQMNGKIMLMDGTFYLVSAVAATRQRYTDEDALANRYTTVKVYKNGTNIGTASTAKNYAKKGSYIGDVESENEDEYPDNGVLGLYYYVKQ